MQMDNKTRYVPKYPVSTELSGIDIVTKQFRSKDIEKCQSEYKLNNQSETEALTESAFTEAVSAPQDELEDTLARTLEITRRPRHCDSAELRPTEDSHALRRTTESPRTQPRMTKVQTDNEGCGYQAESSRYRARANESTSSHAEPHARTQSSAVNHAVNSASRPAPQRYQPTYGNEVRNGRAQRISREAKAQMQRDYDDVFGLSSTEPKVSKAKMIVKRSLLVVATVLILAVVSVYSLLFTVANGPSESIRDLLVLSALQASATKWVPSLFLPESTVKKILEDSKKSSVEIIDHEDYNPPKTDDPDRPEKDEWANAQDGMQFITLSGSTFKAYMLIVKDPSRVFVPTSCDFTSGAQTYGITIFEMAERENAVAAINAGEYVDVGGMGTGDTPIGLTYSKGNVVWDDKIYYHTFIGFTNDNKLICRESMTPAEAGRLGIRDAVSFQTGNVLIENTENGIKVYRADKNTGTAQRTAIGQRADGAIIMLVTDGRTASSIGATRNDVIDIMVEYGAVSAAMLDGGSSALMYYRDYFNKYDYDISKLDKYQKMGLVNNYKAFTTPRRMPTFFAVRPN